MAKFIVLSNASNNWDSETAGIIGVADLVDLHKDIVAYCHHAIDAKPGALELEEVLINVSESQMDRILDSLCVDIVSEIPATHAYVCKHTEDTDLDELTHLYVFIAIPE